MNQDEPLDVVEQRARRLRAAATRDAFRAFGNWVTGRKPR